MAEFFDDPRQAVAGIGAGATVMIGGFGSAGQPVELIEACSSAGPATWSWSTTTLGTATAGWPR